MNEQVRPTTEEPETKPRGVSRRWFSLLALLTGGTTAAILYGPKVSLAAPSESPAPATAPPEADSVQFDSIYTHPLLELIDESIKAAREDETPITKKTETEEIKYPFSYKDLLAHVEYWDEVKEIVAYFIDIFMVSANVVYIGTESQAEIDQMKAAQLPNSFNARYIAQFALVTNAILVKFNKEAEWSNNPNKPLTAYEQGGALSPLRRLFLFLVDVRRGHQQDLINFEQGTNGKPSPQNLVELRSILLYVMNTLGINDFADYFRDEKNSNKNMQLLDIGDIHSIDLNGMINFINGELYTDFIPGGNYSVPIPRRAIISGIFNPQKLIQTMQNWRLAFRQLVIEDIKRIKKDKLTSDLDLHNETGMA